MKNIQGIAWNLLFLLLFTVSNLIAGERFVPQRMAGFQGIWYSNQPSADEYAYKYSGGLGTYCAKHRPLAIYVPEVEKTFFVFGGTKGYTEKKPLLEAISYFDHQSGTVAQPRILMAKGTEDAHHNPTLAIDAKGHLWIFASAHGGKDGFIFKSTTPYSIDEFEQITQKEFTYPQPHWMKEFGFLFLFTKYTKGRELYLNTSADGISWDDDKKIVGFGGHYAMSEPFKNRLAVACNWHPPVGGLNARTNLYYMQTEDYGNTWKTLDGQVLSIPLDAADNPALIRNYQQEKKLVYLKDLTFDPEGNPVILHLVSDGYESGPKSGERMWRIAKGEGVQWAFYDITPSDHNYDMGSLWIDPDGIWRILAPTEPGPQPWCTGGEIRMYVSHDQGKTWQADKMLTKNSEWNHTYVRRPVNTHPDFYAIWADGDALKLSPSRLYYCDREGNTYRFPFPMEHDLEKPEPLD